MSTLKEILESTRQLIATKQAEFQSDLEGGEKAAKGLDTSGAGDDSQITRGHAMGSEEAALDPQKKPAISADANAEPPSDGKGTTGKAEGQDENNQTDRSNTLGSEDACCTPKKKPAVSADADAKEAEEEGAAKLANEILAGIRGQQQAQKEAAATDDKPAEGEKSAEGEKAAEGETDDKPAEDADEKKAEEADTKSEAPKSDEDGKEASGPQMELTTDVLAKIAALVLSSEEGAEFVEGQLAKAAGAEAAQETLAFLAEQSELAEKQAAYEAGEADAEALLQQAIFEAGREAGQKEAGVVPEKKAENLFAKLGQEAADASIAELMGGAGGEMDVPPEAMGAEAMGGAEMGGEEMGGMEDGITEEELSAALEALVQEGTISPEEAQQVVDYISGAGEAEGAADMGAEEAPAEAPEEEPPAEGMEAEAADKTAALLDAIRKVRGSDKA